MIKTEVVAEGVYLIYTFILLFIIKEIMAVRLRQELLQKPWTDDAYWHAPHVLLNLLSYRTQEYQPRDDTAHIILIII